MFRVGQDIAPGEHKLQSVGSYSGYYAVFNDSRQTDIVTNDNFDGTTYITVRSGQYLDLNRCKIVR